MACLHSLWKLGDDWQHIDHTLYPGWIGDHRVIDVLRHDS
jgi:hypothetical protein